MDQLVAQFLHNMIFFVITTNIKHSNEKSEIVEFGLIDSQQIIEEKKSLLEISIVEIILPNWLFTAIKEKSFKDC